MINSITELKELILWLKDNKVKSLKVGEIIVEISDLGLMEHLTGIESEPQPDEKGIKTTQKDWTDDSQPLDKEDEDLFWSTR